MLLHLTFPTISNLRKSSAISISRYAAIDLEPYLIKGPAIMKYMDMINSMAKVYDNLG